MYINITDFTKYIAARIIQARFRGRKERSLYRYRLHQAYINQLWQARENHINNSPLNRMSAIEEWNHLNNNMNTPILVSRQHAQRE